MIKLSQAVEIRTILNSCFNDDYNSYGTCSECSLFAVGKYKTVKGFKNGLTRQCKDWEHVDKPAWIDFTTQQFKRYLELAPAMFDELIVIDPLVKLGAMQDPTDLAIKYNLIVDDLNLSAPTAKEAVKFIFNMEWSIGSLSCLFNEAISANRIDIFAAMLGDEPMTYDGLIQQRKEKLGSISQHFVTWSKDPDYAKLIHPLLDRVTNRDTLKMLEECKFTVNYNEIYIIKTPEGLLQPRYIQAGIDFRKWYSSRADSPAMKVILNEILGIDDAMVQRFIKLGLVTRKCHEILGIDSTATKREINKAYRDLASKHHPDKGGCVEMMKKINQARTEALAA